MGTRGSVGIIFNNEEKIGYNHYDSYPSGLGNEILTFLKGKTIDELKSIFSNITLVKNSDNDVWNWQNHSFNTEFLDQHNFLNDSLFCEFAYIINLDTNKLEYYEGFNLDPNAPGRYAKNTLYKNDEKIYYGVALIKEFDLIDLFEGKYTINNNKFIKNS